MQNFNDIFLNITDDEYIHLDAISQSTICKYKQAGFRALVEKPETTLAQKMGSVFDVWMTKRDKFYDTYYVSDISISEKEKEILSMIDIADTSDISVLYPLVKDMYPKTYKVATVENKISTLIKDKLSFYREGRNKIIISKAQFDNIVTAADQLSMLLSSFTSNKEVFWQPKSTAIINGILYKANHDLITIDHDKKRIYQIDIKTTSKPEYEFAESYKQWLYVYQATLFTDVLKNNLLNSDFSDYSVAPFCFAVINVEKPMPLIWMSDVTTDDLGLESYEILAQKILKEKDRILPYGIEQNNINSIKQQLNLIKK